MREFGKFIDEKTIEKAPKNKGSFSNYNLSEELMLADGYKPISVVEDPTAEKSEVRFRELDDSIEQYYVSSEDFIDTEVNKDKELIIRSERNYRLLISDWTQLPDAKLSEEKKAEWVEYRQQLRDVPEQKGFPDDVIWPKEPELP